MALPATNVGELRATATANMVNGIWFNSARGGTDYTLQDAAQLTATDYASVGASTTLTSATGGFTSAMVGNCYHQTTTGTGGFGIVGWYEIVTFTDANNVVLDRTPNTGTASVACTGYVGGAGSLNSTLDDDFFETAVAGNIIYIKKPASGVVTLGENVSIAAAGGAQLPIKIIGYETTRGDNPTGTGRPTIAGAGNNFTLGVNWNASYLIVTSTSPNSCVAGGGSVIKNVKITNSSTTADRNAHSAGNGADTVHFACEGISYRGNAMSKGGSDGEKAYGCYLHHSDRGVKDVSTNSTSDTQHCIIAGNVTSAIHCTAAATDRRMITNNTIVGTPNKRGTGLLMATGTTDVALLNNIIYGFVTGVSHADSAQTVGFDDYNCYSNNTTDVTNWTKGSNDVTTAPAFTDYVERSGSTATTAASNALVQTGATFVTWGVTAGTDFVYISAGTGVTAGIYGILSVDSETQITVDITLTANATADKVWSITTGHNFLPTGAI